MLDAGRGEKAFSIETIKIWFGRQLITETVEKLNYLLDFRVGCNEQPMHWNIHALYEILNSEQKFTQGIEFGDTEMGKAHKRESPNQRNVLKLQCWNFRIIRKQAEHYRLVHWSKAEWWEIICISKMGWAKSKKSVNKWGEAWPTDHLFPGCPVTIFEGVGCGA